MQQALSTANANKVPGPIQQDDFGFWSKFWKTVYSFDLPSKSADKIIETGQKVAETRDNIVNTAAKGIKGGLLLGPTIFIVGVLLYLFLPAILAARRR